MLEFHKFSNTTQYHSMLQRAICYRVTHSYVILMSDIVFFFFFLRSNLLQIASFKAIALPDLIALHN